MSSQPTHMVAGPLRFYPLAYWEWVDGAALFSCITPAGMTLRLLSDGL
jgi:hypothetical protein